MGPKRSQPPSSQPDILNEITVLEPPKAPKTAANPKSDSTKSSSGNSTVTAIEHPQKSVERLIAGILHELKMVYDEACKTEKPESISIERTAFEAIGNGLQQAYEQIINEPCTPSSVAAASKGNANTKDILDALAKIQTTVANLEKKHKEITAKIDNTPKTYADIIKSASINESKAELHALRRTQQDALRQERARYRVALTMKNMTPAARQSLLSTTAKSIAERCQRAINRFYINTSDNPRIIGVNKLAQCIHLQFETEEEANTVQTLGNDIWNAFEGLKLHEPIYGIVAHGIPKSDLNDTSMADPQMIKRLEAENKLEPGTIKKITPLRRRKVHADYEAKLHHSVVIYMSNLLAANRCIKMGCNVDYIYYRAERFAPQFQVMQCFNCCDFGHRAANCKRKSRCGKCSENHNTRDCKSTTAAARCWQCKGPHEVWHPDCPAVKAEKKRLKELVGNTPLLFNP